LHDGCMTLTTLPHAPPVATHL